MTLAITACSLLTPFDTPGTPGETWRALIAGERLGARAAVDDRLLAGPAWLDRSIRMALAAAQGALAQAHIDPSKLRTDHLPLALFCGTSKGPILTLLAAQERLRRREPLTDAQARHVQLGTSAMGALLRARAKDRRASAYVGRGMRVRDSSLCTERRARLNAAKCARALVVAADASLHPLFEASFARLGVLAPADAQGARRCEPFGPEGRGFFPSEAAVALMVEQADDGLARLDATWIGGDGTGLIAADEEGEALRKGLAHMAARDVTFVHAHATGTAHDSYELAAIRAALPAVERERVFSHKGQLGHSLGAAGLVSVALSAMAHARGELPTGVRVPAGAASLTIAQGFGGHIGIVRLRGA